MKEISRERLLYDKAVLDDVRRRYENELAIKENVDTNAFVYEIRTALRYWFGGSADHRTSKRVWMACKAVDNGMWRLNDDHELADGDI